MLVLHASDHTGKKKKQLPREAGSMPFSHACKGMAVVPNLDAALMLEDQPIRTKSICTSLFIYLVWLCAFIYFVSLCACL